MQLQIEHISTLLTQQTCLTCCKIFEPSLARVIICSENGDPYGDICPTCLAKGSSFIRTRVRQQLLQRCV